MDDFFRLRHNGTDVRTEIAAGITTFLTMSYIIFVQPAVLSGALFGVDSGMDFGAVTMATCLSAALASGIMGLYARYPVAQAPGMGQNFLFVFSIVPAAAALGHPQPWRAALGVVFVAGVIFCALSLLGLRQALIDALSDSMKHALGAGIGLFIAFIGLQNATVVIKDPGTAVTLNPEVLSPDLLIFFVGLAVTAVLRVRRVHGALLWGIVGSLLITIVAHATLTRLGPVGEVVDQSMLMTQFRPAQAMVAAPPSLAPTFLALDIGAAMSLQFLPLIVLVLFMDLFDTVGTLVAVTQSAGLMRDGRLPRAQRALTSDAVATVAGALLGTSTVTSYVESAAGVEQGGRTGLVAVVVAVLFLVALPFTPLIAMVGSYPPITAPALVLVGALMMRAVAQVDWRDATEGIPAFLTFAGIPLTYSIADGVALGLIAYPVLKIAAGRGAEVNWMSRVLAVLLVLYFLGVRSYVG